ncbi:alpha/beta hydrolase family protein [Nocardia tenerifensis]|uniref:Alpha/beta hydrolase family protein n=1 Tax=Nocardia tenerifensis TaxID=228006 RepID=A0A318KGE3_9NOCA|nr:alpha/beta fold hydrolase [Nocardia tenerifensis]PXX65633.1 alpha/beta hydrolase family protein [Nocardia tenerifensis]
MLLLVRVVRRSVAVLAISALAVVPGFGSAAPGDEARPAGLERFYGQQLHWQPCGIENLDKAGGECADVQVPLDYGRLDGRTMTVAISRVKAADPARRQGILLANPGGPGGEGLDSIDLLGDVLSPEVLATHDLIGMDPRGVGESGRSPRCGWPVGEMIRSAGLDPLGFVHDTVQSAGMAAGCLIHDPEQMRQFTTRNTARDIDVVRGVLGEPKIDYFGLSYGTFLGAVFTQMFPERSGRIVLDSAIDPDRYWEGLVQDWGPADERALDEWAAWAATKDDTYRLGATPQLVRATVENLVRTAARQPIVVDDFAVDDHWLPFVLHGMLMNFRLNEKLADVVRELADAAGGPPIKARAPWLSAIVSALRDGEDSTLAQIACGDVGVPRDPGWYWRNIEETRAGQPVFGAMAGNIQPCAFWAPPVEPATVVRNTVPALILNSTGDPRTPYAHAVALHQDMSGSRLVTLQDVRIHMTFRPGLSTCVNDAINTYFGTGTLPVEDTTCYADQPSQ